MYICISTEHLCTTIIIMVLLLAKHTHTHIYMYLFLFTSYIYLISKVPSVAISCFDLLRLLKPHYINYMHIAKWRLYRNFSLQLHT